MPTRPDEIASLKAKAIWVPDAEASACTKCGDAFTVRRRRHHCRLCGGLFCAACSEAKTSTNFEGVVLAKPQRACMDCYAQLRAKPVGWSGASGGAGARPKPPPAFDDEPEPEPEAFAEADLDGSFEVGGSDGGSVSDDGSDDDAAAAAAPRVRAV